MTLVFTC